jgi:hypothetical protein
MDVDVTLVRSRGDRALPRGVFTPVRYSRTAPRKHYRVTVRTPNDAKEAAKFGVPVSLLDSEIVRGLGCPIEFPPRLLVATEVSGAVETTYRKLLFANSAAARAPRPEDVVVAMLFVDWIGARQLVRTNELTLDLEYLKQRVTEEGAGPRAHRVRLEDFVPGLARAWNALSRADLRALDSRVFERPVNDNR